jgi:lipopolysaccharide transport system ATP-binding protein
MFWALKDVSFEVQPGEVIGIIGRNGAGKSTLLKILSQITEPTAGEVLIRGRVGSLLEVGTGFHSELTGRENVFLNGALLGMGKAEIARKFEEIVSFAQVEQFVDTPVKHYSSGMYVRLAFAVAAHLDPEVLIVDEVLAVGDYQFQQKCLGRMGDIARSGRTVLFVSHNMPSVALLCGTAILLGDGRLIDKGRTSAVIDRYLTSDSQGHSAAVWAQAEAPSTSLVSLKSVLVLNEDCNAQRVFAMHQAVVLQATYQVLKKAVVTVSFWLYNEQGLHLFATASYQSPNWTRAILEPGLYSSRCTIPHHFLNHGKYYVRVLVTRGTSQNEIDIPNVATFQVSECSDDRADFVGSWAGLVRPLLTWRSARIS